MAQIQSSKGMIKLTISIDSSAYDVSLPFTDLLNDALALPVFDGGNIGVRRRDLQKLFMAKDYYAWATTQGSKL